VKGYTDWDLTSLDKNEKLWLITRFTILVEGQPFSAWDMKENSEFSLEETM
jgi:hypothetical protein